MDEALVSSIRQDYPYLSNWTYFDHAAVSPINGTVQSAMEAQIHRQLLSVRESTFESEALYDRGRAIAADLVGAKRGRVCYVQNTSTGISLVSLGIDWKQGDNVVVPALEFPSNFLAWRQLETIGVEVRKAQTKAGKLDLNAMVSLIDTKTKAVSISHVQYYSGYRVDLGAIAEVCQRKDALLVVDGTQSVGALAFEVENWGVDVLAVSAHKWLTGPLGIGFVAFSDRGLERITPRCVGWLSVSDPFRFRRELEYLPDARRFEAGTENAVGIAGLVARLEQLTSLGKVSVQTRLLLLRDYAESKVQQYGFLCPFPQRAHERSGIILTGRKAVNPDLILNRLLVDRVKASVRNGYLRLSPHYYNTVDELDHVFELIASV